MTRTTHIVALVMAMSAAASAAAAVTATDRAHNEFSMSPTGVLVIENNFGNVHISGSDDAKVSITADRVIRAQDGSVLAEARQAVQRIIEGNDRIRYIRTVQPLRSLALNPRWRAQVNYIVAVPRTAHIKIVSHYETGGIRVRDVSGRVTVKSMNGPVLIENAGGPVQVENTNGDTTLSSRRGISANVNISSINGSIGIRVPPGTNFIWDVDTVMGDAITTLPVLGGRFITGTQFRGTVNSPTNVTVVTHTFGGNVSVLPHGEEPTAARSVRTMARRVELPTGGVGPSLPPSANKTSVQETLILKSYQFATAIGDVRVDEIRGAAKISTGAGEVHLGTVFGHCEVFSNGGPLTLGEIIGRLDARTAGGNVTVQRAREGGIVTTGGGTILVQYAGAGMRLSSGGGDIVVRHALGPVNADTRSGDIAITMDAGLKSERIAAKTTKGNIILNLPGGFGADIDAVVITTDPAHAIRSELAGLSIQRDQVGGKTRIRATGKINGGGQRVELHAQDGGIRIAVDAPRVSPQVPR